MIFKYLDYSKPAKELLLDLIEENGEVTLRRDDLVFSNPVADNYTKTKINVAGTLESGLKGNVELTYNRIGLDYIFFGHQLIIETDETITKELLSDKIKTKWNVLIEPNEFSFTAVNINGLPVKVTITALPESLVWLGQFDVWVFGNNYLATLFKDTPLGNNTGLMSAFIYSMEKTFEPLGDALIFEVGQRFFTIDTTTQPLLDYLLTNTGDPWTIDPNAVDYNLYNSKVIYTDTNKMVIDLSLECKNFIGYLVIHF